MPSESLLTVLPRSFSGTEGHRAGRRRERAGPVTPPTGHHCALDTFPLPSRPWSHCPAAGPQSPELQPAAPEPDACCAPPQTLFQTPGEMGLRFRLDGLAGKARRSWGGAQGKGLRALRCCRRQPWHARAVCWFWFWGGAGVLQRPTSPAVRGVCMTVPETEPRDKDHRPGSWLLPPSVHTDTGLLACPQPPFGCSSRSPADRSPHHAPASGARPGCLWRRHHALVWPRCGPAGCRVAWPAAPGT